MGGERPHGIRTMRSPRLTSDSGRVDDPKASGSLATRMVAGPRAPSWAACVTASGLISMKTVVS